MELKDLSLRSHLKNLNNRATEPKIAECLLFENLMTYSDLSNWLSVPVKTLEKWVHRREIPFLKAGRHVRFDREKVKAWLQKNGDNAYDT